MKIAVDAMGGDNAPLEIVAGALEAAKSQNSDIILVGKELEIKEVLTKLTKKVPDNIFIHNATEVIGMNEPPAIAVKKKKDNSLLVSHKLVKDGLADGVVSAGSTGAQMVAALITLGRISNISRPTIATFLPTFNGPKLLLDVGANVDCKPENLLQFAQMGSIYAQKVLGYESPKIGLINIGTEEIKGNKLTQKTYSLLKESNLNFVGNIEPRNLSEGIVDVAVCDGFTGNCLLKFGEGISKVLFTMLKEEIKKRPVSKIAALGLLPAFKALNKKIDYEEFGGVPLLGIKGVSIICHGSSSRKAITNAIKVAIQCVENNLVETLSSIFEEENAGRDKNE